MTFIEGNSIETLAASTDQQLRNEITTRLIELTLREFLEWGVIQTDPNFANFLYNPVNATIGLVDFGAVRVLPPVVQANLQHLLQAVMQSSLPDIAGAACEVGYIQADDPFNFRIAVVDLLITAAEPILHDEPYPFGSNSLARQMTEKLYQFRKTQTFQRIPPAEILFLHRKLAGIFLLAERLRAQVNVRAIIERVLEQLPGEPVKLIES